MPGRTTPGHASLAHACVRDAPHNFASVPAMLRADIATAALSEQAEQRIRIAASLLAAWRVRGQVRSWDGTRCTLLVADIADTYGRQAYVRARSRGTPVLAFGAHPDDCGHGVASAAESSPAPALAQAMRELLAVESAETPEQVESSGAMPALCRLTESEYSGRAVDATLNGRRIRIRPQEGRVYAASLSDLLSARDSFASQDWALAPGNADGAAHGDGASRSLEAFLLQSAHQGRGQLPAFPAGHYRLKDWPDVGTAPELVGALKIARLLLRGPASADEIRARCGVDAREVNASLWAYRAANLLETPSGATPAPSPTEQPVGAFSGVLARIALRFGLGRT